VASQARFDRAVPQVLKGLVPIIQGTVQELRWTGFPLSCSNYDVQMSKPMPVSMSVIFSSLNCGGAIRMSHIANPPDNDEGLHSMRRARRLSLGVETLEPNSC